MGRAGQPSISPPQCIHSCRVLPQTAGSAHFPSSRRQSCIHPTIQRWVSGSQTLGGAAFGCGGEGVVFSYEWAATPLLTAVAKLGQTLTCLSLWSFEPRANISDGAVSEEVLRACALVGCSRCCSYGCCCPSLLLVPCRGDQEVGGLCWRSLLLLLLEPLTGAPGPVPDSSVCHSHPPTLAILRTTGCCLQLANRHLQSSHCDCG